MARILVVDDSDFIKSTLKELLGSLGHTIVAEASDGKEALNMYKKHMPDLVTTDITMQGLDGIATIRSIIKLFPDAKIIVISAVSNKDLIFKAINYGAKNYIFKPFSIHDVEAAISEAVG